MLNHLIQSSLNEIIQNDLFQYNMICQSILYTSILHEYNLSLKL